VECVNRKLHVKHMLNFREGGSFQVHKISLPQQKGQPHHGPHLKVIGKCTICMAKPADYLITPCGHQCGCHGCLCSIKGSTGCCPICRAKIGTIQRVFHCTSTKPSPNNGSSAEVQGCHSLSALEQSLAPCSTEQQTMLPFVSEMQQLAHSSSAREIALVPYGVRSAFADRYPRMRISK
jgi:hypothetical protein